MFVCQKMFFNSKYNFFIIIINKIITTLYNEYNRYVQNY